MIKNGQQVIDAITGFQGTVTGVVAYLTGCQQALVQPPVNKDGAFVDARWFDMDRLIVTSESIVELPRSTANGSDKAAPIR